MSTQSPARFAVEIEGLTRRFGDKVAVDNLTLQIAAGSTFGFIGPNGAGKTTTIKMLMNMLRASAGRARVLGIDVAAEFLAYLPPSRRANLLSKATWAFGASVFIWVFNLVLVYGIPPLVAHDSQPGSVATPRFAAEW